jgi:hypothetical protein
MQIQRLHGGNMHRVPTAAHRLVSTLQVLSIALFLLIALSAHAQVAGTGSIQGAVTDSTGAVIPNADVTLIDQATQVTRNAKTNGGGNYSFPNIGIGTYSLSVGNAGFQTYMQTGIVLEVGSSISIDAKMTVGSADIKVEVHANGLAQQTEDSSFKQTIDRTELTEMPLNGRHMTDLITLAGGSNGGSTPGDAGGGNSKYPTQTAGISIAGAPGNTISYRLDGGDNNDYMGGQNNPLPFPDAIGQFSVETAALGAQSGTQVGGLVNIVTQSGTNKYHGSAFEFIRNNFINSTGFFSSCTPVAPATTCSPKDTLHQDQYGGTLGGPIIHNKLFAFAAFQHQYQSSKAANQTAYVPTAANLAGDFSATDSAGNCSQPILNLSDPITGQLLPGNKYNQPGGPVLPKWNAAALALIAQLPVINPAVDTLNCGKVVYSIPSINTDNEFDTRVDYSISQNDTIFARYFLDSQQIPTFYSPTNILVTTQSGNPEIRYQTITIGENHVFSSNLINSIHLTATRRQLSRGFNPATPNASAFGIKDFQAVKSGIWIGASNNNHGFTAGGGSNLLAVIDDNIPVALADDVTWIRGKHQIALGGSFVHNQLNVNNGYESNGQFSFSGIWSGANAGGVGKSKAADPNLDLLEGAMNVYNQSLPQQNALRGNVTTLYVQDTFHATPRLTVTGGVNWEPLFFPHDYFHRGATFNMAAFLANQHSAVYPNAPAGMFFYGDQGVKAALTQNSPWQFNPNFAFTYDVSGNGKTVVRAGTEYAYNSPNFFAQQRVQQNPPFSVLTSPNTSGQLCFSDPWLIAGTNTSQGCGNLQPGTTNPLPGSTDVSPFPFNAASFTFPQQAQIIVLQPTYKAPNTLQWTASIAQQLPHGWSAQIFYTGSRSQHLLAAIPLNPSVYVPGVWGANGTGCPGVVTTGPAATAAGTLNGGPVGTPCSVNNINKTSSVPNNQQARYALTMANPAQGNYYAGNQSSAGPSLIESNVAYSNYNGVILTVQHRFSSTFSLLTNYTWSKCLNDADPQGDISGTGFSNPNNQKVDYGRCGQNQDVRHIFNASLVLKSVFPIHGLTGYLVNNWELAPLVRITSGTAINVNSGSYDNSFTGNGGDRPNLVPGVNPYNYAKIKSDTQAGVNVTYADRSYLNPAAFVLNTVPGTQGNVSRNKFSGPMAFQNDAQLSRIFPIRERYNLDLRLEAFNVLNHPSFNNPNNGGPTFGGTFGEITSTSINARVFQGAVKVSF